MERPTLLERIGTPMYLPENNEQMFDILSELRVYAATNRLVTLAEQLDDALIVLARENRDDNRKPATKLLTSDLR